MTISSKRMLTMNLNKASMSIVSGHRQIPNTGTIYFIFSGTGVKGGLDMLKSSNYTYVYMNVQSTSNQASNLIQPLGTLGWAGLWWRMYGLALTFNGTSASAYLMDYGTLTTLITIGTITSSLPPATTGTLTLSGGNIVNFHELRIHTEKHSESTVKDTLASMLNSWNTSPLTL